MYEHVIQQNNSRVYPRQGDGAALDTAGTLEKILMQTLPCM